MRILVVKQSSLGDLFHALPAVHALKRHYQAPVDWVVNDEYVPLVQCFTDVDRIIPFPRRTPFRRAGGFLAELRRERYDLGVDLQGLLKSAAVLRLARVERRVGPSNVREGAGLLYTEHASGLAGVRHAVEVALDVPRHLGIDGGDVRFPVAFPKVEIDTPRPRVAFVPCSRWEAKNWAPERFAELGRHLQDEFGATIFLCGGAKDHATCDRIADALDDDRCSNLAGSTGLIELGGLLAEMDLVVTVDSGPMHMASALGVPVLAIFGATDPRRTGPFGPQHRVAMAPDLAEAPDLARSFKKSRHRAAWDLPVGSVLATARAMLGS